MSVLTELAAAAECEHTVGMTWTTDAPFHETKRRIDKRREEGCVVVEMEAAAMIAVAAVRSITYGQVLYAADDLSGTAWSHRNWLAATEARRLTFDLAAAAAMRLSTGQVG